MEEEEIIEKIDKFLNKEGLDAQGKYFITKKLNEEYWGEIQDEGDIDDEDDDSLDDVDTDDEPEEPLQSAGKTREAKLEELGSRADRIKAKIVAKKQTIKGDVDLDDLEQDEEKTDGENEDDADIDLDDLDEPPKEIKKEENKEKLKKTLIKKPKLRMR